MNGALPPNNALAGVSAMETAVDLASLKRTRTSIKGRITRLGNWIASVENISDISLDDVETRLNYLTKCFEEFEHTQSQIEVICDDEGESESQRSLTEESFYNIVSTYKKFIRTLSAPLHPPIVSHPQSDDGTNTGNMFSNGSQNPGAQNQNQLCLPDIKLPPITLPTFSGQAEEFASFSELFKSLVDDSPQLSNITRFYYLRSALKGSAANVIQSLPATAINYDVAWSLLNERYQATGTIIDKLNLELLNLQPIHSENPVALRKLLDNATRIIRSLTALGTIQSKGDSIFVSIIISKLDGESKKLFRMSLPDANYVASIQDLQSFLSKRLQVLESLGSRKEPGRHMATLQTIVRPANHYNRSHQPKRDRQVTNANSAPQRNQLPVNNGNRQITAFSPCILCKSPAHRLPLCPQYKDLSVDDKIKCIRSHFACFNCLGTNHVLANCMSKLSCFHCGLKHHSSIHRNRPAIDSIDQPSPSDSSSASSNSNPTVALFNHQADASEVILGTANILINDIDGHPHVARVLMDAGSQGHLITRELVEKLRLPVVNTKLKITGIANSKTSTNQRVFSKIMSRNSRFAQNVEFLVLPVITTLLPVSKINTSEWRIPSNILLADENYHTPSKIDILLGAELFYKLLETEKIEGNSYHPTLIKTRLGWMVCGNVPTFTRTKNIHCHISLTETLEKFWRIDECAAAPQFTAEELECEDHFVKNHSRAPDGRYIVRLPFRKNPLTLGHSRSQARRRWLSVEARLARDKPLREGYTEFMKAYIDLGHMTCVGLDTEFPDAPGNYFLPHHPVIKSQSSSTKIRVVFDGSMKGSNGTSLNNILMVGPTIQAELFEILLRFRRHEYVFIADVQRMYRQVLVDKRDRAHQLIFWRESPTSSLCVYELNTVTYGTSSAPFLATRSLKQLALDERANFPNASITVLQDFYVDDVLSGHDILDSALHLQQELISLLNHGGFPLKKWAANHSALLEKIPVEDRETLISLNVTSDEAIKTLGLTWIPTQDIFLYNANNLANKPALTKRQILSQIASLWDPLGIIGPIVCTAKIFMQELWREKYDWDQPLPTHLTSKWENFNQSLSLLPEIRIPRFVACKSATHYEIHGFSDASLTGYGCALYLKTINAESTTSVRLLCAKSRVAPAKQITLPRLELCAALLLVRQLTIVTNVLKFPNIRTYCWSDSKIALAWISSSPHQWKTFVANRVSEIQDYETIWKYVPSEMNPADLISRGTTVNHLKESTLWWGGPAFLSENEPPLVAANTPIDIEEPPERKKSKNIVIAAAKITHEFFSRFSATHTLVTTVAWVRRFLNNAKKSASRTFGPLNLHEREAALFCLIRLAQAEDFSSEIHSLRHKGITSKKSKLRQLAPFLDANNILRVGGRLKNSTLSLDQKHPIILSPGHPLTSLIITQAHLQCLHGGIQLVLSVIRQKYWIVNGKNVIRKILHRCIKCFKNRPRNDIPMMGQLPSTRSSPARPFFNTGVDFAGPFLLKAPTRSNVKLKYYVSVFVCFSTKATHFELVGSLTAENFLATLKRFVARRGLCQTISCDNATNFVGTRNLLKEVYSFLKQNSEIFSNHLAQYQIKWNFVPPLTPHFGGLWEAAVKSMKYHLKRIAGLALLNYEEFLTILCAIEACLNSRPLTPLSTDPSDLEALTPGHFLIGAPLLAVPEIDYTDQPMTRLTRWHRTQSLTQHFWKRWSLEYISTLTPLSKWTEETAPLTVGKLVLIKDDHLPPLHWKLGRITATHPGKDNVTRVATIRTATGEIVRNACKIYPLPIDTSS